MLEATPDPLRDRLLAAGLRPTRQRLALAALLLDGPDCHLTAEAVWRRATDAGVSVSLATVYNTLNGFVGAGLLRMVDIPGGAGVFDTNTRPHHHALVVGTGELRDLPLGSVTVKLDADALPGGARVEGIDVVVHIRD